MNSRDGPASEMALHGKDNVDYISWDPLKQIAYYLVLPRLSCSQIQGASAIPYDPIVNSNNVSCWPWHSVNSLGMLK